MRPHGIKSSRKGLTSSRGRADVIYQCHGDVPQAEAPRPPLDGKTLDIKPANSGHKRVRDCQKNVSMPTVRMRPTMVAARMAGMHVVRTKVMPFAMEPDLRIRYRQCAPSSKPSSRRNITAGNVNRYKANLVRLTLDLPEAGSGRKNRRAMVPS